MSARSVLRIGPADAADGAVAALRSALAGHFRGGDEGQSAANQTQQDGAPATPLHVSNRYFSAEVSLVDMGASIASDVTEDGMILVFDAAAPSAFDALALHHDAAVRSSRCGDLLRLCVGASRGPSPLADGSKKGEEEYSRRVLWCLDRGYEYVEVDWTPGGMARGFDDRDKDGFARVAEAVGTCLWSSRAMKPRNSGGVAGGAASDATKKGGASETQLAPETNETGDAGKEIQSILSDAEREKAAVDSLLQGVKDEHPDAGKVAIAENNMQQHRQEEMAFHQLESVLAEAKMLREASRSNAISDEERRERAGETAMRLMGLLDGMGLDDETDDERGSESS
ncbi:hypothetical protein ACHAXT_005144 [Thalassiosira profunda]